MRPAVVLLAMALFGVPSIPASAQGAVTVVSRGDDELLLCALTLDNLTLNQALECYVTQRGILVPMGEVCRLIEFGIEVRGGDGRANGSLADPATRFELDMSSGSVLVAGKPGRYDPFLVEAHEDDIYVESVLLGTWLGMDVDADPHKAMVRLIPAGPLPLQLRMAREKRGGNVQGYKEWTDSGFPRVPEPYRFLSGPSIDLAFSPSADFMGTQAVGGFLPYSLLVSGDALWLNGYVSFSGDFTRKGIIDLPPSVVLGRIDPEGGLLGPLHASEVELGNNVSTTLPLLGAVGAGMGVLVSNFSLLRPSGFDFQTLEGLLLPGWDVELYVGRYLFDYRRASSEGGRYLFRDIPLNYGMNDLRLVFHGPLGEERVEEHTYNVGSNMLTPGAYNYRAVTSYEGDRPQMAFEQEIGLTKNLTIGSSLLPVFMGDTPNLYAGLSLSGYLRRLQSDLHVAYDVRDNAWSGDIGIQTEFNGLGLSFLGSGYSTSWIQPQSSNAGTLPSSAVLSPVPYAGMASVNLNGMLRTPRTTIGPFALKASYRMFRFGGEEETFVVTQSHMIWPFNLRHNIQVIRDAMGGLENYAVQGSSTATARFSVMTLNGGLSYGLYPKQTVDSLWFGPSARLTNQIQLSGMIQRNLGSDLNMVSLRIARTVNPISIGLNASWCSDNTWSVGISGSLNISRDSRSGAIVPDANGLAASSAGISARAFLDSNHNGSWDPGETPLEGVGYIVNNIKDKTRSGVDGEAFLRGIQPNRPTDVSISLATLPDVFMTSANKGLSCVPRPGYSVPLDFPVWITGEISGTVFARKGDVVSPAPGINVAVLDGHGRVVRKVRSEYDGFYLFTELLPGKYLVRIQDQKTGILAESVAGTHIDIPETGAVFDNTDLTFTRPGALAVSGEISGTVFAESDGAPTPVAYVSVVLMDGQGRSAGITQTEYDGFYSFNALQPGRYLLRIQEQASSPLIEPVRGNAISITSANASLANADITFVRPVASMPPTQNPGIAHVADPGRGTAGGP